MQGSAPAHLVSYIFSIYVHVPSTLLFYICLLMTPYVGLQAPEERVATDPPQDAAPVVSSGCLNAGISPCTLGKLHFVQHVHVPSTLLLSLYPCLLMAPYVGLQVPERVSTDLTQDAAPAVFSG